MKTKTAVILIIAIAFIVGCQKDEIKSTASVTTGGIAANAANYPNGCCCAIWGTVTSFVQDGMIWMYPHPTEVIIGYYGCGTTAGSVGSGVLYPVQPQGQSGPIGSLTLVPGMQYDFYQNNTFIASVVSDGNGHVELGDISAGTYDVIAYFDDEHETKYIEMTLPMPSGGWLVKLDEL